MVKELYEELGNAVILQAVKDYREAKVTLRINHRNYEAQRTKAECERFFKSGYFSIFSAISGKSLLAQLEKEE